MRTVRGWLFSENFPINQLYPTSFYWVYSDDPSADGDLLDLLMYDYRNCPPGKAGSSYLNVCHI